MNPIGPLAGVAAIIGFVLWRLRRGRRRGYLEHSVPTTKMQVVRRGEEFELRRGLFGVRRSRHRSMESVAAEVLRGD